MLHRLPLNLLATVLLFITTPLSSRAQIVQALVNRVLNEGSGAGDNMGPNGTVADNHDNSTPSADQFADPGAYQKTFGFSGSTPLATIHTEVSQNTTFHATDSSATASGVLAVHADGSTKLTDAGLGYYGGTFAHEVSLMDMSFTVSEPMGMIFDMSSGNSAHETSDQDPPFSANSYANWAEILFQSRPLGDTDVRILGDLDGNNGPQGPGQFHKGTGKVVLRIAPDPGAPGAQLAIHMWVEHSHQDGGGPQNIKFSFDRQLTFNFALQALTALPEFTSFDVTAPNPQRSSSTWKFTAAFPSTLDGINVHVESSPTGEDGTWSALPGTSEMKLENGVYALTSHDIPASTRFFHAVADSPLAKAPVVSKPALGPYNVLPGFEPPLGVLTVFPAEVFTLSGLWPKGTYGFFVNGPDSVGPKAVLGLRVHIQWRRKTDTESTSWFDLSDGGTMSQLGAGSGYELESNILPVVDHIYYRAVASAPGYEDSYSNEVGPFDFREILYTTEEFTTSKTVSLTDLSQNGSSVNVQSTSCANVTIDGSKPPATPSAALALSAAKCGSVTLAIPGGATVPGSVVALNGATIVSTGNIRGNVVIAPPAQIVAQGGGNLLSPNGSNVVSNDGGTMASGANTAGIVAQGGGNIVAQGGGNIVAQGAGNIVAQGGGNIISQGAGNIVAQGGGNAVPGPTGLSTVRTALAETKTRSRVASVGLHAPAPAQPAFTGIMSVDGNYSQYAGTLCIGIAGTDTAAQGAQQYDQLRVTGTANLFGGSIAIVRFDPNSQTNLSNAFQPQAASTFDVVVAKSIVLRPEFGVRGQVFGDGKFFHWGVVDRADGVQALRLTVTNVAPLLGLLVSSNQVQVGYATNYTGYAIQSSPTLSPTSWRTLTADTNVVTLPATNPATFFRLIKP